MFHDLARRIRTAKFGDKWRMRLIESKGIFNPKPPGFTLSRKPVPCSSRGCLIVLRIDPDNEGPMIELLDLTKQNLVKAWDIDLTMLGGKLGMNKCQLINKRSSSASS